MGRKKSRYLLHGLERVGRIIGGCEGDALVRAGIVWPQVDADFLPPSTVLTKVKAIHSHEPVWAGN